MRTHTNTWNKQVDLVAMKFEKNDPQFTYVQLSFVYFGQPDSERARKFACVRLTEINDIWQLKKINRFCHKPRWEKNVLCTTEQMANKNSTLSWNSEVCSFNSLSWWFAFMFRHRSCHLPIKRMISADFAAFKPVAFTAENDKQPNIKSAWQYYIASKNKWSRFVIFAFALRKTNNYWKNLCPMRISMLWLIVWHTNQLK